MQKLPVNLDEVAEAMDQRERDMLDWYLDLETGSVILVSNDYDLEDMEQDEFDAMPPQKREELADSWRVLHDDGSGFERIPEAESRDAYRLMEQFIDRVPDPRVARELEQAIAGKGAFRRFKEALSAHPRLQHQWYAFEAEAKCAWARQWLEDLGIESTWQPPALPPEVSEPPVIFGLDHAQITVPRGQEKPARQFYCDVLKMKELPKPAALQGRGGFWLAAGELQLHVGVEDGVNRSATKAHLAYRVNDIDAWARRLREHNVQVLDSVPIPGCRRFEFRDPFGNRIEMLQPEIG